MEQIRPVSGAGTGRIEALRPAADATGTPAPPSRALVVIDGGKTGGAGSTAWLRDGRAEAGFVAQLLLAADPTLTPSRLVRTRQAAARYAETARLVG